LGEDTVMCLHQQGNHRNVTSIYSFVEDSCVASGCSNDEYETILNCSHVKNTSVIIPRSNYWETIDLSSSNLSSKDVHLESFNVRVVILSNNNMKTVPVEGLPSTLEELYLQDNQIKTLPLYEEFKKQFPLMQKIDLSNNDIERVSPSWLPVLNMAKLSGNPLICDCDVYHVFEWLNTYENASSLQALRCNNPDKLYGAQLHKLDREEFCKSSKLKMILPSVLIPMLAFGIIIANFIMHKRREDAERQGIIEGFQQLLQVDEDFDEGDHSFAYDAFVSYEKNDQRFVDLLIQELEVRRNHRLCVHERDFQVGVDISENIVTSITRSARVIIVVSNEYINSSWCQYEVQIALTEMHEKRKRQFLIPVLLHQESKKNTVRNLDIILSVITGMPTPPAPYPSDDWTRFYERLNNLLP